MNQGDIIQITDSTHAWYGCLLVVDEVRAWGVTAYLSIPRSNDGSEPAGTAFNRLNNGTFEKVGAAILVRMPKGEN